IRMCRAWERTYSVDAGAGIRKNAYANARTCPASQAFAISGYPNEGSPLSARRGGIRAVLRAPRLGELHPSARALQHHAVEPAARACDRLDAAGRAQPC